MSADDMLEAFVHILTHQELTYDCPIVETVVQSLPGAHCCFRLAVDV